MLKKITPEKYILLGIIGLFLIGSLFHFIYQLTGKISLIGLFVPTNESVFEHLKMIPVPMIGWWSIFYIFKKNEIFVNAWFSATLIAMITACITVPLIFYFYTQAFGIESVVIDILILLIAIALGQVFGLHYYRHGKGVHYLLAITIMILIIIIFAVFTVYPPNLPIFIDSSKQLIS